MLVAFVCITNLLLACYFLREIFNALIYLRTYSDQNWTTIHLSDRYDV